MEPLAGGCEGGGVSRHVGNPFFQVLLQAGGRRRLEHRLQPSEQRLLDLLAEGVFYPRGVSGTAGPLACGGIAVVETSGADDPAVALACTVVEVAAADLLDVGMNFRAEADDFLVQRGKELVAGDVNDQFASLRRIVLVAESAALGEGQQPLDLLGRAAAVSPRLAEPLERWRCVFRVRRMRRKALRPSITS